jgi:F0F1-type ATP synthase alpha subunit
MAGGGQHFDKLIAAGNAVGEVIAVEKFLIKVRGLQPCAVHALVMFADGSKGFVHQVYETHVVILHLGVEALEIGMVAVIQYQELVTKVGKDFIGRVVSVIPLMAKDLLLQILSGRSLTRRHRSTRENWLKIRLRPG